MNNDVLKHLIQICGHTLIHLECYKSPNITDDGLNQIINYTRTANTTTDTDSSSNSSDHTPLIRSKQLKLKHLSLDNVNVSTDSVLDLIAMLQLKTFYLGTCTPIISDVTLGTVVNMLTTNGCVKIWLINTLTTDSGAPSSLRDMISNKGGNVRGLEELYVAELNDESCQEIADMWEHVDIVRASTIWRNGGKTQLPRNGQERLHCTLVKRMRNEIEFGVEWSV
tara:strand:+ start:411 stop:1082 length:672 start_codon:yes stop_codon:yes gene_type:complete